MVIIASVPPSGKMRIVFSPSHSEVVLSQWEIIEAQIRQLFQEQWSDPELPGMEYRSSDRLADWLASHGFDVERRAGGLPTAFTARRGQGGGPVIALLAEYDALPGLDNDATAIRRSLGRAAGHACGHNHIGPANTGAAIAAAEACRRLGIAGEIRVIGCPAEEILWGKIALLQKGVFSEADAILTSHGDYQTGALSRPCQSVVSGEFVFSGEAGHGGQTGHRNALLVAEDVIAAASRLCDGDGVLLRHVLRQAGIMPSITPAEARVWFTTRSIDYHKSRQAYDAIAETAADLARRAGVALSHQFISESRGYLPNDTLGHVVYGAMKRVGPPNWSRSDLAMMRELCRSCSPEEEMELDRGIGFFDSGQDHYGQDDGEVSWRIPVGRLNWAYPRQVPIHHWAWTALSGHPASHPGPLAVSKALALAAVNLLSSPELVEAAKRELSSRTSGVAVTEPRLGAVETMTRQPEAFWSATWRE